MRILLSLALAASACAADDETSQRDQASSAGASCANPTAYGAILNDGLDDTAAIRGAICSAVCPLQPAGCAPCTDPTLPGFGSHAVCLPGGELDATRPASGFASFKLQGLSGLTIYGEGPGSVLAMHGAGTGTCTGSCSGAACPFSDWNLFEVDTGSAHVELRDLTMTSTGVAGFDKDSTRFLLFGDQTTNTDDLVVQNTRMTDACGDDLFIIGGATNTNSTTTAVRVIGSTLLRAARRAIVIKHGTRRIEIANNTFDTDGGAIDFDPSATDTAANEVIIANNSFRTASATSIVLAGESSVTHPAATNVVVANNLMFGPGIVGGQLRNIEIRNNTIINTLAQPEIDLVGVADQVDISHNTILRGSTATVSAIRVAAKELASPATRISGNTIVQASQAPAIEVDDITRQVITNNIVTMTWADTAHPAAAGIKTGTDHFDVDSCQMSGNAITGTALAVGLAVNLTSTVCGIVVTPAHCGAAGDPPCQTGTFCDLSAQACRCDTLTPMHIGALQADRNLVVGATTGIRFGVGRNTKNVAKGFLRDYPMIANNDFSVSSATAVDLSGIACDVIGCVGPAYLLGGNRGGPVQLVGDNDPTANAIAVPDGSLYMKRSGTGSASLYVRENSTWVAQ